MTDETFHMGDQGVEFHIARLMEKLEAMRGTAPALVAAPLEPRAELRALELWRAVISECLATFFYVVLVCGAAGGAGGGAGAPPALALLAASLAAGLAAATLTHCFRHISGAHMNPAVTVGLVVTRQVTPLRAALFIAAQCGGGIAGAALLLGVTVPGYQGSLQAGLSPPAAQLAAWERFGLEFVLTFIVVFTHCVCADRPPPSSSPSESAPPASLAMGAAYSACSLVSLPYLNPARALGPAFVLNRWDGHWVQWAGPLAGGVAAALLHEVVFSGRRRMRGSGSADGDSSSVQSDEDAYDDLDKPQQPHHGTVGVKFPAAAYSAYRPTPSHLPNPVGLGGYCPTLASGAGLYPGGSASAAKLERVESLYGGTRSLYCKSPTLTRANLHRSQSVYSKPPRANAAPAPGPLLPARDLYRLDHQVVNQNAHNQIQARESAYATRPLNPGTREVSPATYGQRQNPAGGPVGNHNNPDAREDVPKMSRRPDSMYGMVVSQPRRNQSAQSDDSSYGSYRGGPGSGAPVGAPYHLPPPATHQY